MLRNNFMIVARLAITCVAVSILMSIFFCCSPIYNQQKMSDFEPLKYDIEKVEQDEQAIIFAAFSGGGSRAAAMCWEALKEFKKILYNYSNNKGEEIHSNLADQIDYISGISGGSFAAAAWCLFKDSMEVFDERFINKNIQRDLVKKLLFTHRIFKVLSPRYNRINVASELYDEDVFSGATFGDDSGHPTLWINSTALALGLRFTYSQKYFDFLESDIRNYPIGYACAASSAFPILLDPITLWNYGETKPDSVISIDAKYRSAKRNSARSFEKYFYAKKVEFFNNKKNRWVHMADGGLVDNQGLQVILDQFATNGIINKRINNALTNPLKRIVFININAGVLPEDKSSESQSPPHVLSVINYTMTISMDRLSAKRWEEVKLRSMDKKELMNENGFDFENPYFIEINFRNIKDDSTRSKCMKIPTSFKLSKDQRSLIKSTVASLIEQSDELNRLRAVIK